MNSLELAKKRAIKEPGKSKKSKLDPHYEAIKYLLFELEQPYTLLQVQKFLEEDCKTKVAYSTLQEYVKRRFFPLNNGNKKQLENIQQDSTKQSNNMFENLLQSN